MGSDPRMFKWPMAGMLLAMLGLVCSEAFAVREEHTFDVSIQIPGNDFYVLPVNPVFLERDQRMHWNTVTRTLAPLREHFDVKNISGGVTARLGAVPSLFNGADSIALSVSFNGHLLGLTETTVVAEEQARVGLRVPLVITAVEPEGGYLAGEYYGSVQLVFDALRP